MTFGEFAESFGLNLLSNSIKYRKNIDGIKAYEAQGNAAGVYQEAFSFIWSTIWFENLYVTSVGITEDEIEQVR